LACGPVSARDFRRWLQVERRAAASTVNLALASLDALYRCLGLGRPHVRRDKPALAAPRALDEAAQRRLLRAADNAPVRSRALVVLMLFTALRDLRDRRAGHRRRPILTRKGVLVVIGKGDVQRRAVRRRARVVRAGWPGGGLRFLDWPRLLRNELSQVSQRQPASSDR
jgi:integrase